ncbi:hypothetical protein HDU93_009731 [Gonapodya sp. JEL0774]|nr:hypothetical protein HDU93_009731 [Gonapodya sp. JEL0774]
MASGIDVKAPETKPVLISWLRYALLNTGNWYLVGHGVDDALIAEVKDLATKVFDLPASEEARLDESNSPHFWGLTRVGHGTTDGRRDYREDFDLGNDLPCVWKDGDPLYLKTRPGPNLWPSEDFLPDFKRTYKTYIAEMNLLGNKIEGLIEEALGIPPGTFAAYKDENVRAGGRVKIARYPPLDKIQKDNQEGPKFGVGPHKDLWLTFSLPANGHSGDEVANPAGTWIPCAPLSGVSSFVVHVGSALESITRGAAMATPHRAINPASGNSRFTVYYLHEISPNVTFEGLDRSAEGLDPELVATAKARRRWWILRTSLGKGKLQNIVSAAKRTGSASVDDISQNEGEKKEFKDEEVKKPQWPNAQTPIGEVFLVSRIRSRPKVARKFYPELANLILGPTKEIHDISFTFVLRESMALLSAMPSSFALSVPSQRRLQSVQAAFEYFLRTINPPPFTTHGAQTTLSSSQSDKAAVSSTSAIGVDRQDLRVYSLLDTQLHALTFLIVRDFIQSWYYTISKDDEFIKETVGVIARVARELEARLEKVDFVRLLTSDLPLVLSTHLSDYRLATRRSGTLYAGGMAPHEVFRALQPHFALRDEASEREYLATAVELVLKQLLPRRDAESDGVRNVLREILTGKLMKRALDAICDPDFLNDVIVKLLSPRDPSPPLNVPPFSDSETNPNIVRQGTPSHLFRNTGPINPPATTTPLATAIDGQYLQLNAPSSPSIQSIPPRKTSISSLARSTSTNFARPTSELSSSHPNAVMPFGPSSSVTPFVTSVSEFAPPFAPTNSQPAVQFVHPPRPSTPDSPTSSSVLIATVFPLLPSLLHFIELLRTSLATYLVGPLATGASSVTANLAALVGLASYMLSEIRKGLTDAGLIAPQPESDNATSGGESKLRIKRWRAARFPSTQIGRREILSDVQSFYRPRSPMNGQAFPPPTVPSPPASVSVVRTVLAPRPMSGRVLGDLGEAVGVPPSGATDSAYFLAPEHPTGTSTGLRHLDSFLEDQWDSAGDIVGSQRETDIKEWEEFGAGAPELPQVFQPLSMAAAAATEKPPRLPLPVPLVQLDDAVPLVSVDVRSTVPPVPSLLRGATFSSDDTLGSSLPGGWVNVSEDESDKFGATSGSAENDDPGVTISGITDQIQAILADYRDLVDERAPRAVGEPSGIRGGNEDGADYDARCQRDEGRYAGARLEQGWLGFIGEVVEWRDRGWWVWNQVMFLVVPIVRWMVGRGMNRLIIRSIHRLFSESSVATIFRAIRMTVWPGGRLGGRVPGEEKDKEINTKRTEEVKEDLRRRAEEMLREKVPDTPDNSSVNSLPLGVDQPLTNSELRQMENGYRALQEILGGPVTGLGYGYEALPQDDDENEGRGGTLSIPQKPPTPPHPPSGLWSKPRKRLLNDFPDVAIISGWEPPRKPRSRSLMSGASGRVRKKGNRQRLHMEDVKPSGTKPTAVPVAGLSGNDSRICTATEVTDSPGSLGLKSLGDGGDGSGAYMPPWSAREVNHARHVEARTMANVSKLVAGSDGLGGVTGMAEGDVLPPISVDVSRFIEARVAFEADMARDASHRQDISQPFLSSAPEGVIPNVSGRRPASFFLDALEAPDVARKRKAGFEREKRARWAPLPLANAIASGNTTHKEGGALAGRPERPPPLEYFDDEALYETKSPETWIAHGPLKGDPHTRGLSRYQINCSVLGLSRHPESNKSQTLKQPALDSSSADNLDVDQGNWEWRPCWVVSYDGEANVYEIEWVDNAGLKKHVKRLNLMFEDENRERFHERYTVAEHRRAAWVRWRADQKEVEGVSVMGGFPVMETGVKMSILARLGGVADSSPSTVLQVIEACWHEVEHLWTLAMKRAEWERRLHSSTLVTNPMEEGKRSGINPPNWPPYTSTTGLVPHLPMVGSTQHANYSGILPAEISGDTDMVVNLRDGKQLGVGDQSTGGDVSKSDRTARQMIIESGADDATGELLIRVRQVTDTLGTYMFTGNSVVQQSIADILGALRLVLPPGEGFFTRNIQLPTKFRPFEMRLTAQAEFVHTKLSYEWPRAVANSIEGKLSNVFQLRIRDAKEYERTRLKDFLVLVGKMLEVQLKQVVVRGLASFLAIMGFTVTGLLPEPKVDDLPSASHHVFIDGVDELRIETPSPIAKESLPVVFSVMAVIQCDTENQVNMEDSAAVLKDYSNAMMNTIMDRCFRVTQPAYTLHPNNHIAIFPKQQDLQEQILQLYKLPLILAENSIPNPENVIMVGIYGDKESPDPRHGGAGWLKVHIGAEHILLSKGPEEILKHMQRSEQGIQQILSRYQKFEWLLQDVPSVEISDSWEDKTNETSYLPNLTHFDAALDLSQWEKPLTKYSNVLKEIDALPSRLLLPPLMVDCAQVKEVLSNAAGTIKNNLQLSLIHKVVSVCKGLSQGYEELYEKIAVDPQGDAVQWKALKIAIEQAEARSAIYDLKLKDIVNIWQTLYDGNVSIDDGASEAYWEACSWPRRVQLEYAGAHARLDEAKGRLISEINNA